MKTKFLLPLLFASLSCAAEAAPLKISFEGTIVTDHDFATGLRFQHFRSPFSGYFAVDLDSGFSESKTYPDGATSVTTWGTAGCMQWVDNICKNSVPTMAPVITSVFVSTPLGSVGFEATPVNYMSSSIEHLLYDGRYISRFELRNSAFFSDTAPFSHYSQQFSISYEGLVNIFEDFDDLRDLGDLSKTTYTSVNFSNMNCVAGVCGADDDIGRQFGFTGRLTKIYAVEHAKPIEVPEPLAPALLLVGAAAAVLGGRKKLVAA